MGRSFNRLARLLGLTRLGDTQCGFKAYRSEAAAAIFERQTIDGFACDLEALFLAREMGFRVEEMPVRWINSRDSRVRLLPDSADMFIDLLRLRRTVRRALVSLPYQRNLDRVATSTLPTG